LNGSCHKNNIAPTPINLSTHNIPESFFILLSLNHMPIKLRLDQHSTLYITVKVWWTLLHIEIWD